MRNYWKPSFWQLVAIGAAGASGHGLGVMAQHMWDESWPLWVHALITAFFTGLAFWATWLHNRRVSDTTHRPRSVVTRNATLRPPKGTSRYEQQKQKAGEISRAFYRRRYPWWKRWLKR